MYLYAIVAPAARTIRIEAELECKNIPEVKTEARIAPTSSTVVVK